MKHKIKHIHFVGIGGIGMSGIAEVLLAQGFCVSGSDSVASAMIDRLVAKGARVFIGHSAAQVAGADVIVVSSAIASDNPEITAARAAGTPVIPRAVMLGELMRFRRGIAVAGTHGKTTTTSLIAHILTTAGLDPLCVIGGKLSSLGGEMLGTQGSNVRQGAGEWMVAEADESDASFLHLHPTLAVVTNIDQDHMATYGHDVEKLTAAFVAFVERIPFYGAAVVCVDDPGAAAIISLLHKPVRTVGLSAAAGLRAVDVVAEGARMHFRAVAANMATLVITLNLAGVHNVRNALAAIAVARECGCSDADITSALASFAGVGRRFQSFGEINLPTGGRATLIDDYGHHPVEIAAVLAAARGAYPKRRILLAFQPHRYSRTQDLFADFAAILANAEATLLAPIYAAGEAPIDGITATTLAAAIDQQKAVVPSQRALVKSAISATAVVADVSALPAAILRDARDGDVVLVMGAGSIGDVAPSLAARQAVVLSATTSPAQKEAA